MSSHFNNTADNQEQVFSEDQFRTVFFDSSKRTSNSQEASHNKRARLDPKIASISRKSSVSSSSTSSASSEVADALLPQSTSSSTISSSIVVVDEDDEDVVNTASNVQKLSVDVVGATSLHLFDHGIHPSFVSSSETGCVTPSNIEEDEEETVTLPISIPTSKSQSSIISKSINHPSTIITPITVIQSSSTSNKPSRKPKTRSQTGSRIHKYRSRSLPNILFPNKPTEPFYSKLSSNQSSNNASFNTISPVGPSATSSSESFNSIYKFSPQPPLPPVNLQSLKEIDLSEIIKNPQLRHDILFDPQLQFRPNLDGERGRRKRIAYDRYWNGVKEEIKQYANKTLKFNEKTSRLPSLFLTLREILISLLPSKDQTSVMDVLDIELTMQQLVKNTLDFISLAEWLSQIFKSHCAPMRDILVDEMMSKFVEAQQTKSLSKLVEGLRMIFRVLEAMKLDIANHQIRILRPVLIETAVDFERDYFSQMITRCKLDISDSIKWFKNHHQEAVAKNPNVELKETSIVAVLSLLSCSNMVSEFPSSLAFDHSRLIGLRANVRQLVCMNLCLALYRQLVFKHSPISERGELLSQKSLNSLKKEIFAIITDDNGNIKWTRNIGYIALQIVRRALPNDSIPKDTIVEFGFNWLIKQTQPSSQVYSLMEQQIFNSIRSKIEESESAPSAPVSNGTIDSSNLSKLLPMASGSNNLTPVAHSSALSSLIDQATSTDTKNDHDDDLNDLNSVSSKVGLVCKFHWQVFGSYYSE